MYIYICIYIYTASTMDKKGGIFWSDSKCFLFLSHNPRNYLKLCMHVDTLMTHLYKGSRVHQRHYKAPKH